MTTAISLLQLKNNLKKLKEEIGNRVCLVAVSKHTSCESVQAACELGQGDFGENRVQQLVTRGQWAEEQGLRLRWHFIGPLQSNKVKALLVIPQLQFIHSVSSKQLLQEIIKHQSKFIGDNLQLFLQVNTSGEAEKGGIASFEELVEIYELGKRELGPQIKIQGLMTMGKIRTHDYAADALRCFEKLKNLQLQLGERFRPQEIQLSMGMSDDYLLALQLGTHFVRIGTKIFG